MKPRSILVLLTGLGLLLTASAAPPTTPDSGLKITISVYSGRPDPFFHVREPEEIAALAKLLADAPADTSFERGSVIPSILGYRGIIVENFGGATELPDRFAVYAGHIEVGNKSRVFRIDRGRSLENHLLDLALERGAITAKLFQKIQSSRR